MLPEPDDLPSGSLKRGVDALVALHVPPELGSPVPLVRGGLPTVLGTDMPEASVDEDCDLLGGEDDVGPDLHRAEVETEVLPVTEPHPVESAAQGNLRLGVSAAVGLHVARPPLVERCRVEATLVGPLPSLSSLVLSHTSPIEATADCPLREDTAAPWPTVASSGPRRESQ